MGKKKISMLTSPEAMFMASSIEKAEKEEQKKAEDMAMAREEAREAQEPMDGAGSASGEGDTPADNTPQEATEATETGLSAGRRVKPVYVETRSRRVQIVLQPSLYSRARAKASSSGMSFNDYVHKLIEEDVKGCRGEAVI